MSETKRFINLVKKFPILYDTLNEVSRKEKTWKNIGEQMNQSAEEVKKKWKNLRDTYVKYLRKEQANKPTKLENWKWFNEMKEFKPYLSSPIDSISEMQELTDRNVIVYDFDPVGADESHRDDEPARKKIKIETENSQEPPYDHIISYSPSIMNISADNEINGYDIASSDKDLNAHTQSDEMDANEMFFMSLARTVKKLPRKRQVMAMMEISKIIMQQELLDIDELTSN